SPSCTAAPPRKRAESKPSPLASSTPPGHRAPPDVRTTRLPLLLFRCLTRRRCVGMTCDGTRGRRLREAAPGSREEDRRDLRHPRRRGSFGGSRPAAAAARDDAAGGVRTPHAVAADSRRAPPAPPL